MAYTELFVKTTGSNLNGGGIAAGTEPPDTAAYTSVNGNWNGASIFTPVDGSTPANFVNVGDFASVYIDGSTVTGYVARVTAVAGGVNGEITLSTTAKSGTAPTSSATARSIKVGGAWKGPNLAEGFPFGFIAATQTNAAGDAPRVNFKSGTNYAITAAMTHANNGPIRIQGYTTTPGDLGRATIDGGTVGAAYILLNATGTNLDLRDLVFQNNGATGAANAVVTGVRTTVGRCVVSGSRGNGFAPVGASTLFECEAFNCNLSSSGSQGGFFINSTILLLRCISHDHPGATGLGVYAQTGTQGAFVDCIFESNGGHGINAATVNFLNLIGCEFYNNGGDGLRLANAASAAQFYVENCNFIKNGGYGINGFTATARNGTIINCGFGSGIQANTSGATTGLSGMNELDSVTYPADVTPWVDPANGDFRINLAQTKGAGRGNFTQTAAGYAGTVGYPDRGAAQHLDSGAQNFAAIG